MCVGTLVCGTLDTNPVGRFRHCCCRSDYRAIVTLGVLFVVRATTRGFCGTSESTLGRVLCYA